MSGAPRATRRKPIPPVKEEPTVRFKQGMRLRRMVLGNEHVDEAWRSAETNEQLYAMEEFITDFVWGTIWNRPGLPSKTRSLLTLALLIAANRAQDLGLHIRSAVLRNDCTLSEVREVILHCAAFCGVPAASEAFNLAQAFEEEMQAFKPAPFRSRAAKAKTRKA